MTMSLCFDDLSLGDRWTSPARTITETDVVNFAGLTGDFDPLHVDHQFARTTPFGRPIVHGLLGLSLVAGLGSHSPRPQTLALVGIRDWNFARPVFFGDTVHVETEVVALQAKGRRSGLVTWRRKLVNQDGDTVQEGVFETLVATRRSLATRVDPASTDPACARSAGPSSASVSASGRSVANSSSEGSSTASSTAPHTIDPP